MEPRAPHWSAGHRFRGEGDPRDQQPAYFLAQETLQGMHGSLVSVTQVGSYGARIRNGRKVCCSGVAGAVSPPTWFYHYHFPEKLSYLFIFSGWVVVV